MGALLCAFSIRRFRELSYEIFLIGHIIANVFWVSFHLALRLARFFH